MSQQNGIQKLLICFQKILHFLKLKIFKKSVADSISTYMSINICPSVHSDCFHNGNISKIYFIFMYWFNFTQTPYGQNLRRCAC